MVLEARNLHFSYGRRTLVSALDLVVGVGECVAVVGPNGAGKTTLFRLLSDVLKRRLPQTWERELMDTVA